MAGTGVENCKSNKPHIQREYLSGDSITPAVMPDDRCGPISSGSSSFICKSQVKDPAVNSRGTPREESHKNSDSDELVLNPESRILFSEFLLVLFVFRVQRVLFRNLEVAVLLF